MSKPATQPTDRIVGRTIVRTKLIEPNHTLAIAYRGFRGATVVELDDGSVLVASRMQPPHGASELLLVAPDGDNWTTVQPAPAKRNA